MTAFILTCSSEHMNLSDTLSTLRFGQQASKLRNRVRMNKELSVEMLKSIIAELEGRISYYQRLEADHTEKDRFSRAHNEEAWQQLKGQFEDAVEERELLRFQLDKWLDERGQELVLQKEKEEKAETEIFNLQKKVSQVVVEVVN